MCYSTHGRCAIYSTHRRFCFRSGKYRKLHTRPPSSAIKVMSSCALVLQSNSLAFPGHSQILSCSHGEKSILHSCGINSGSGLRMRLTEQYNTTTLWSQYMCSARRGLLEGVGLVPMPLPFLPSVCIHNNTQELVFCSHDYFDRKRKVNMGAAWKWG